MITATLKILGKTYTSKGSSPLEAISGFSVKNAKGKAILVLENGDVKTEKILMPLVAYRLFNSHGLTREVALKNASLLFDGL